MQVRRWYYQKFDLFYATEVLCCIMFLLFFLILLFPCCCFLCVHTYMYKNLGEKSDVVIWLNWLLFLQSVKQNGCFRCDRVSFDRLFSLRGTCKPTCFCWFQLSQQGFWLTKYSQLSLKACRYIKRPVVNNVTTVKIKCVVSKKWSTDVGLFRYLMVRTGYLWLTLTWYEVVSYLNCNFSRFLKHNGFTSRCDG